METVTYKSIPFIQRCLNIVILSFPITSFLLLPSIQGTTIITIFGGLLFGLILFLPLGNVKFAIFKELFYFVVILLVLSFLSQLTNLVSALKLSEDIELINRGDYLQSFYRLSHITQTLYLVSGFIVYILVKYFSDESIIKYIYWALRLLCFYALYELAFYMVTGQNGDFVTNRTVGYNDKSASLFQTITMGGISLLRLKGYTGEPSMFTFILFPFWVMAFAFKRYFDILLILLCLGLSFSTTAYLGVFAFLLFWFTYKRQYNVVIAIGFAIVGICVILQLDAFSELLRGIYDSVLGGKLSGEGASSRDRSYNLQTHLLYWSNLGFMHHLVGIGFGYVRSTDFFSTLLLNSGAIGFLIFTWFMLRNVWAKTYARDLNVCYKAGLIGVYIIMMASVPEFGYASLWVYAGVGYILQEERLPLVSKLSTT